MIDENKINFSNKYDLQYLRSAHYSSLNNEDKFKKDEMYGCYTCLKIFEGKEIYMFMNKDNGTKVILCPECGQDTVLCYKFPVSDPDFLRDMSKIFRPPFRVMTYYRK